jgi:hypothetical protein
VSDRKVAGIASLRLYSKLLDSTKWLVGASSDKITMMAPQQGSGQYGSATTLPVSPAVYYLDQTYFYRDAETCL